MKHGIIHLFIFICFAACFYGCRSPRSATRKTVTEATGEEKQTTTDGVIELARRDSSNDKHTLHVHREDSTHIRINYDSLGRIKEIDFSNRKTEKELERIKAAPSRNIKKLPVSRKQPLPVNPTLGSKARKKKRLQTGVAYGRS
ncbi:hypothetical protein NXW13_18550 [Bacteroides thetaiotaomicron]|nr:hypothetical protein [Bacteroides thetaiotaomicron]